MDKTCQCCATREDRCLEGQCRLVVICQGYLVAGIEVRRIKRSQPRNTRCARKERWECVHRGMEGSCQQGQDLGIYVRKLRIRVKQGPVAILSRWLHAKGCERRGECILSTSRRPLRAGLHAPRACCHRRPERAHGRLCRTSFQPVCLSEQAMIVWLNSAARVAMST
jgi:hypothetical protein